MAAVTIRRVDSVLKVAIGVTIFVLLIMMCFGLIGIINPLYWLIAILGFWAVVFLAYVGVLLIRGGLDQWRWS